MIKFPFDKTNASFCLDECEQMVAIAREALAEKNEKNFMEVIAYAIYNLHRSFLYAQPTGCGSPFTVNIKGEILPLQVIIGETPTYTIIRPSDWNENETNETTRVES